MCFFFKCQRNLYLAFVLQVIKMLMIVVALFAICWLPIQTYNLLSQISAEVNKSVNSMSIGFIIETLQMLNQIYISLNN